jgi:transposase
LLPWPAVSSDLSPIEHVWDEMEQRLRHLPNQPVTLAEMRLALICIWNNIPQAFFNNLVRSLMQMVDTHATDFVDV